MERRAPAIRRRYLKAWGIELDSHFWLFSVSIYGSTGVQKECVELQDSVGIDVNILLFCAFVGAVHGALLSEQELSDAIAAVAQWQEAIIPASTCNAPYVEATYAA